MPTTIYMDIVRINSCFLLQKTENWTKKRPGWSKLKISNMLVYWNFNQVASAIYDEKLNKYKAKCGGSLQMWEESGWINEQVDKVVELLGVGVGAFRSGNAFFTIKKCTSA